MSRSRGGTPLFLFLTVLTAASYCSRPEIRSNLSATSQVAPTPSTERPQEPSLSSSASSEPPSILYVRSIQLNVRSAPNGPVLDTLKRGTPVGIYEFQGKWARISRDGVPEQWVSGPNLCSDPNCADTPSAQTRSMSPDLTTSYAPAETRSHRSNMSSTYDCPCSGSTNCIGPRGGRYCITSGGNKRYR